MFVIVMPEKGLRGLPSLNELFVIFTCMVLMICPTMVCEIYLSMVWMYYPSTFVLMMYVVCTDFPLLV